MCIDSYSFGKIKVNGSVFRSDIIIYPDRIDISWRRLEGHMVIPEDIALVLHCKPDILIIGTGFYGRMRVSPKAKEKIGEEGIELIVEKTGDAVKTFNEISNARKAIAALHLTC